MKLPTEVKLSSHRQITGMFVVAYKKLVKLLIAPYLRNVFELEHEILGKLEMSVDDNKRYVTEEIEKLDSKLDTKFEDVKKDILKRTDALFINLDRNQEDLEQRIGKLETTEKLEIEAKVKEINEKINEKVKEINEKINTLEISFQMQKDVGQHLSDMSQEINLQKRRLDMILSELRKKMELNDLSKQKIAAHKEHLLDHAYFLFENRYRGEREEIIKRQKVYIPMLKEVWSRGKEKNALILDVGCGRGELLELLKENEIPAIGIDINEDMIHFCSERGFQVKQVDAISYLQDIKDSSLCGIIACQFIEHLPINTLIEFLKLSHKKLKKNGKVIFETVNPKSLIAMNNFYLDLSHQKPIHPQSISFLLESTGFYDTQTKYFSPVPESFKLKSNGDENIEKLNNILFGYQDFAVIATK